MYVIIYGKDDDTTNPRVLRMPDERTYSEVLEWCNSFHRDADDAAMSWMFVIAVDSTSARIVAKLDYDPNPVGYRMMEVSE